VFIGEVDDAGFGGLLDDGREEFGGAVFQQLAGGRTFPMAIVSDASVVRRRAWGGQLGRQAGSISSASLSVSRRGWLPSAFIV